MGAPRRGIDIVSKPLTPRQSAVIILAAAGQTNTQIAQTLGITEKTVKNHLNQVYKRSGAENRNELKSAYGSSPTGGIMPERAR
jgi:DNA-binding NarL/FixJ family response regulator